MIHYLSVWYGLNDLVEDGLSVKVPGSVNELRKKVITEVCKNPEKIGIRKIREHMKELRAMTLPGVPVFQEVLSIVSFLFGVVVFVHFGGEKPIIYKDERVNESALGLHVQCLGGVHYNWVIEKKTYERKYENVNEKEDETDCEKETMDVSLREMEQIRMAEPIVYCSHGRNGNMEVKVGVKDMVYCGLIDTGAQVSLVNKNVIEELEREGVKFRKKQVKIRIHGIGKGELFAWEEVQLGITLGNRLEVEHNFIVLKEDQLPFCFILGIEFLSRYELIIDVGKEQLLKRNGLEMQLPLGSGRTNIVNFVGYISLSVTDDNEILSDDDLSEMQDDCPVLNELKRCVIERKLLNEWPECLSQFKRFAERFIMFKDLIYFVRKFKDGEEMYVPVMSLVGMIGLVKVVHNEFGHLGRAKLWECMKGSVFHPCMLKVVTDVATTCEDCQKRKIQGMHVKPPVLKVDVNEPFEMVVIDCVSFPRSARGNVGMLVMVDHKSKFGYAAPLKDKTSLNVANVMSQVLLPMCVKKPRKCLSDNGPEFVGRVFEEMLKDHGINHILTTPYVPSSNGLAERTVRTMSELLRMCCENVYDWDLHIGKMLWAYNSTVHRATGMSPGMYVMNFEKMIRPKCKLGQKEREMWKMGNEKFNSFEVGDKVLKSRVEVGRLNVNKFKDKYEGPYVVKQVWSNGVTYILESVDEIGRSREVRAHQSQLRKWREPPSYLKEHPVYELCNSKKTRGLDS